MAKLIDIKGYWNMANDWDFDEKNVWEGQILLQEDGWFEGIVVDPHSEYTQDRFVFGACHEGCVIFLNKFTPLETSTPLIFQGEFNGHDYTGEVDSVSLMTAYKCGNARMLTEEVHKDLEEQSQELTTRIEGFKNTKMNKAFMEIYHNLLVRRQEFTEEVMATYFEKHPQDAKRIRH